MPPPAIPLETPESPELVWRHVEAKGTCCSPEMVVAKVAGGRIFAGTVWDSNKDEPRGGWHLLFVPDVQPLVRDLFTRGN